MTSLTTKEHASRVAREMARLSRMSAWLMRCVPADARPAVMVRPGSVLWSTHVDAEERYRSGRSAVCRMTKDGMEVELIDHGAGGERLYGLASSPGDLAWAIVDAWIERGAMLRRAEEHKASERVLACVVKWED